MPARDNHYTLLDLDVSASTSDIRLALERLSRKADALAYTAPEESQALWAQIRQIRGDLLSGRAVREAYDLGVVAEQVSGRPDDQERAAADSPPSPTVPAERGQIEQRETSRAVIRWAPIVGVVAVLLALVLALSPLGAGSKRKVVVHPAALALTSSGPRARSGYVSGQTVRLSWSSLSGATLYRLQMATAPVDPSDRIVFRRPLRTIVTAHASYSLRVVGLQLYYWRVQALVRGRWTRYTHSRHFLVDRPAVPSPIALASGHRSQVAAQRVRLCWTRVPDAAAYSVQIEGIERLTVRSSCASLQLYPGTYRWTVAALAQGVRLYVGKASRPVSLTVSAPSRSRLVALRQPPRPAGIAATATPQPQLRPAAARGHVRTTTLRQKRVTARARSSRARIIAVSITPSRSPRPKAKPRVVRTLRIAPRRGVAAGRQAGPARSSEEHARAVRQPKGRRHSRHQKPARAPGLVPPPPPPPTPAAANPPPVSVVPAQSGPPAVIWRATPTAGAYVSYVYPSPTPGRAAVTGSATGGSVGSPLPSSPSYPSRPIAPTPSVPIAGSPPPPAAPTAAGPSGNPSGNGNGRGRGSDHGDREDHSGNGHPGHGSHP